MPEQDFLKRGAAAALIFSLSACSQAENFTRKSGRAD